MLCFVSLSKAFQIEFSSLTWEATSTSRGFWRLPVLGTSSETPFGIDFCFQEDAAAPQKCKNFVRRPSDFEVVRFSARVAIRTRFWTLPGSIMITIWPPKTILEFVLERPRAVQEHFFSALEASESCPRRLQESSRSSPRARGAPRCALDLSRDRF